MDLTSHWPYLEWVVTQRLAHNQTERQYIQGEKADEIAQYKHDIELLGAAGELAARRFLKLPEHLHIGFDNGVDLTWNGYRIDVKATHLTSKVQYRYLQWWVEKWMKSDIILMTAIDLKDKQAEFMGYAWASEVVSAPVNDTRDRPCHEIAIPQLKNIWNLWSLDENREETPYTPGHHRAGSAQYVH